MSKEEKIADTKVPSEQKEQAKPKPKARAEDPKMYNPGGEKVLIKASAIKRNGLFGRLVADESTFSNLAIVMSSSTYPTHCKVDPLEHLNRDAWTEICTQLVSVVTFKQAAFSLRTEHSYVADHFGKAVSKRIECPAGLLPLIRPLGTIYDEKGDWEVIGQPIIVSTMLLRGVGRPQEVFSGMNQVVNRRTSIGFDPHMPFCWQFLLDYAKGKINQWTYDHPLTINLNGVISVIEGARFQSGAELFFTAFQATQFPLQVLQALRIAHIAEQAIAMNPVPVGNAVPVATIGLLNAEGVVVFNWSRVEIEQRFAEYYSTVSNVMHATLDEMYTLTNVIVLMDRGTNAQLVTRMTEENAYVYRQVEEYDLKIGAMLNTTKSGVDARVSHFRVETNFTPLDEIVDWFRGMAKGKVKQG